MIPGVSDRPRGYWPAMVPAIGDIVLAFLSRGLGAEGRNEKEKMRAAW